MQATRASPKYEVVITSERRRLKGLVNAAGVKKLTPRSLHIYQTLAEVEVDDEDLYGSREEHSVHLLWDTRSLA